MKRRSLSTLGIFLLAASVISFIIFYIIVMVSNQGYSYVDVDTMELIQLEEIEEGAPIAVIDTTINLPSIPGGKKLIYTHIDMPLTAIADFGSKEGAVYKELDRICKAHKGLWCVEAENYLLAHASEL